MKITQLSFILLPFTVYSEPNILWFQDYNGTGERYTFVTSLNVAKDQKQGTQEQDSAGNQSGQMQHGQMPPTEEAQRWDSDY